MKSLLLTLIFCLTFSANLLSQDKGVINGVVTDKETQQPVQDAIVEILELNEKTASNSAGNFEFKDIPYGTYQLKVTCIGYEAVVKTDIVVLSSRPSAVTVELMG